MKKIIVLCLITVILTGCKAKKKEDISIIKDKDEIIIPEQQVDELKFKNTSLVIKNNKTEFTTQVINETNSDKYVDTFTIIVKDKNNNVITNMVGYVGGIIKANDSKEIVSNSELNLNKAYNVEYQIK